MAVDGMERYRAHALRVCPVCGKQSMMYATCRGTHAEPHDVAVVEEVEYVPASQLRGAVGALQQIASRAPFGTSSEAGAIAVAHGWLEKHGYPTSRRGR